MSSVEASRLTVIHATARSFSLSRRTRVIVWSVATAVASTLVKSRTTDQKILFKTNLNQVHQPPSRRYSIESLVAGASMTSHLPQGEEASHSLLHETKPSRHCLLLDLLDTINWPRVWCHQLACGRYEIHG